MHFAAESHGDRSIHGPGDFVLTNVVGTFRLLEAACGYWQSLPDGERAAFRFLHVSTDEVYGTLSESDPAFSEATAYAPNSPYSASKAGSDHLVRAWHHTYGLPVLTTNCSNNYGPFQFPEKLIPLMIANALEGRPLPVYGDGRQVRDWHLRLNLAVDPEAQIKLLLNYADERVDEMAELLAKGDPVPQEVHARYEKLMGSAMQTAAGLTSQQMLKNMGAIQLRAMNQERLIKELPVAAGVGALTRQGWEAAVEEQLQILEIGLQDPQAFQNQFQHQDILIGRFIEKQGGNRQQGIEPPARLIDPL